MSDLQLVNSSSLATKEVVLGWPLVSKIIGLHGKPLKQIFKGINPGKVVNIKVVQLTGKPKAHQVLEPLTINFFVKESLKVGSDIID